MYRHFAYALLAVLSTLAWSQTTSKQAELKAKQEAVLQVTLAEQRRLAAVLARDPAALDSLLADDLTYVHSTAWTQSKTQFIASIRTGELQYLAMDHRDLAARIYGSTAVLTGTSALRLTSPGAPGKVQQFEIRFTTVYVQQQDRWRQVAWQSTRVSSS
jgi:ketosteroid isomerase-like protein